MDTPVNSVSVPARTIGEGSRLTSSLARLPRVTKRTTARLACLFPLQLYFRLSFYFIETLSVGCFL
jgi:hypothetical protein